MLVEEAGGRMVSSEAAGEPLLLLNATESFFTDFRIGGESVRV